MWYPEKIPKIIYFYWDKSILSYLRFLTVKTFSKLNPDWKLKFYYPKDGYTGGKQWNHQEVDVKGKNYFDELTKIPKLELIEVDFEKEGVGNVPEVFRSDLLRLNLLATYGGLWSDLDILYFRPMTDSWFNNENYKDYNTLISFHPTRHHYSIGFLGSAPNNPFYAHLYTKGLERIVEKADYQYLGIQLWHNYFNTPNEIIQTYPECKIIDIQMDLTYSFDSTQIGIIYNGQEDIYNPKTIAFHWYAGHPISPSWQNKLTEENWKNYDTTITKVMRRVLE